MRTAYVLGGGGLLGAHEVGMLRALSEAGIRPDMVVGTSLGAVNGAFVAADPDRAAERLSELWGGESLGVVFSETVLGRAVRLARSGTHLHAITPLRELLAETLPVEDFRDLKLPFNCVAACIEAATARWFSAGPVVQRGPGSPGRLAVRRGPRPPAAGGGRRPPLLRRRPRRLHPGRSRG